MGDWGVALSCQNHRVSPKNPRRHATLVTPSLGGVKPWDQSSEVTERDFLRAAIQPEVLRSFNPFLSLDYGNFKERDEAKIPLGTIPIFHSFD